MPSSAFDFDPCPFPLPEGFDGLTCEWGASNYVNPPFGSIIHQGKKKGPTAWVRKAIAEWQKGKRVVLVYPIDKWVLMLLKAILGAHACRSAISATCVARDRGWIRGQGHGAAHRPHDPRGETGWRAGGRDQVCGWHRDPRAVNGFG
jgi:hypothetical protein